MLATILLQIPLLLLPAQEGAPPSDCQSLNPQPVEVVRTLDDFGQRVDVYVALHRRLEQAVPAEQVSEDWGEMLEAREALAEALRQARPGARQGEIFTPAIAALFRTRVDETLVRTGVTAASVLAAINEDNDPGAPPLKVNAAFPWESVGSAMWPSLLQVLPALPPELQYRFVNTSLVLIDVHADLVVDILENVLPEG
jgi:hypothetical protein